MIVCFNNTLFAEIYTLSLHDALPICRHLARKLSLRRKRSSPNVFEMAATETITSIILKTFGLLRFLLDRKSGSAGMPRPISYAVFCLKKKKHRYHRTST